MTTRYVVDTHALVWFLKENPRLGSNAKTVLQDSRSELVIPIIVLAEACWMIERGKTSIPSSGVFLDAIDADPRVSVMPLDWTVLRKTSPLTSIAEMHDRQDANIRDSGLVPVIW